MRDRPDGAALLRQARATLLQELLEELPEARRYEALMVANAMAIAARELEAGAGPLEAERAALAAFYDVAVETADPAALNRRLAAAIRAGAHDADATVHLLLREAAVARLLESNPKALERA